MIQIILMWDFARPQMYGALIIGQQNHAGSPYIIQIDAPLWS